MKLSNFSLMKEDGENYHIGHPKGRTIVVPKKGLSEKSHAAIKGMQKFYDGGDVKPDEVDRTINDVLGKPSDQQAEYDAAQASLPKTPDEEVPVVDRTPAASAPIATPTGDTAPATAAAPSIVPDNTAALTAEEQAIKAGAAAEQTQSKEAVAANQSYQNQVSNLRSLDDIHQSYQQKDQQLEDAYRSGKIEPNRYLHNMSTGSKIASGIGILLSGLGGSSSNMGMEVLDRAINRDIDAQKNDQSKNMNLWKMNREAEGSDEAANIATRNQMLTGLKVQLEGAAAKAQGPMAAARIAPAVQAIEQEKAMGNYRRTLLSPQAQGGVFDSDPSQLVPMMVKDPKQAEKVYEEIGRAQNVSKNSARINELFQQAAKDSTVVNTMGGLREPGSVMELKQLLLPNFKQVDGTVRQAAMDETFRNVIPSGGDAADKTAHKAQALKEWMHSETAAPVAKGNGIDLQRFRSTSADPRVNFTPQQQQFYAFAKANPKDPRSALILQKLGVQ